MSASIRVGIADDQELVRTGLRAIMSAESDIDVVGEADDGVAAVDLARQRKPDVLLMDIRMPNLDGIEATRRIVSLPEPPRVVILTTFDRSQLVYEALLAGATGFLLKDVPREQLIGGIRAAARGEELLAPLITRRLIASSPGPGSPHPRERTGSPIVNARSGFSWHAGNRTRRSQRSCTSALRR